MVIQGLTFLTRSGNAAVAARSLSQQRLFSVTSAVRDPTTTVQPPRPSEAKGGEAAAAVLGLGMPLASTEAANSSSSSSSSSKPRQGKSVMDLVGPQLSLMFNEIHTELDAEIRVKSDLNTLAKYYFDGQGKAIRPVIAMALAHAFNVNFNNTDNEVLQAKQRKVAIISEMIHTASLVHDDVIDKADTRRGKAAVTSLFSARQATLAGDYIIAIGSKLISQIRNEEVVVVLAQILKDLVQGEFQQLQVKKNETERFQLYLNKTFNKTASLIAYSCKANAILSRDNRQDGNLPINDNLVNAAYEYGRNLGIAFQLVDDLLDFVGSSKQLGKPAAADLKLGLATAPVLFASSKFPELEPMISRRFSQPGDVESAFRAVLESDGLDRTRELAQKHCNEALNALKFVQDSDYKSALIELAHITVSRIK